MPVSASVRRLYLELLSLSVYRGVLKQPVTASLMNLLKASAEGETNGPMRLLGRALPDIDSKRTAGQSTHRCVGGNFGG